MEIALHAALLAAVLAGCLPCIAAWKKRGRPVGCWAAGLSLLGALLAAAVRSRLYAEIDRVRERLAPYDMFPDGFLGEVPRFAVGSMAVTLLLLAFFLGFLAARRNRESRRRFDAYPMAAMALLLLSAVWFGAAHFNKFLDTASYALGLAACESMTLFLPLGVRRALDTLKKP